MLRLPAALLVLAAATAPALAADADPWAPAAEGKILCSSPDAGKKTCESFSEITLDGQGGMIYTDHWFQPDIAPGVIISITARATLRNGRSCMVYDDAVLDGTRFERDGQPVPDTDAATYRGQIKTVLADVVGHELCMRLSPYGRSYSAQMSIDGFELAQATRWATWVSRDEGYRLAAP